MIHSEHRDPLRKAGALVALLALGLALAWLLPPTPSAAGIAGYAPLHTLLETIAVVIASLVFAVGWNAHSRELPRNVALLSCAFIGVALLDFSHALSFAGMPAYVTPSDPEKAINFWLAARSLAALALLAAALAPWRPFASSTTRYWLLAAVLGFTAFAHWLFLFHPDVVPRTFVPGLGLTPFKTGSEYALIGVNVAAALVLWRRMRAPQPFKAAALFVAVCAMALSEFFFTLYASVSDVYNLLGHLYKVIAYLFLYHAIFVETVERPQRQLREQMAQRREAEIERDRLVSVLEATTDMVSIGSAEGQILYLNRAGRLVSGVGDRPVAELQIPHFHPAWAGAKILQEGMPTARREGVWSGETALLGSDGREIPVSQVIMSHKDAAGNVLYMSTIIRDIAAARRGEDALRVSEHRLLQAARVAHIGIFDHDHLTDTIYWSAEQRRNYGFSADEPVTLAAYLECVFPDDKDRIWAAVQRAHDPAGDGLFDIEHRIIRRDGAVRVLTTRARTLFSGEGAARHKVRTIGAVMDITETKAAEQALRLRDEALRTSLNAVAMSGMDGRLTYVNDAFLALWGLASPDEALGRPADEFWQEPALAREVIGVLLGGAGNWRGELVGQRRDGSTFDVAVWASLTLGVGGAPVGLMASFLDITDRKRIELALKAEQQLNQQIIESSPVGICIYDSNGDCIDANPAMARHIGATLEQVRAQNIHRIPSWKVSGIYELACRTLESGQPTFDLVHLRSSFGKEVWLGVNFIALESDRGRRLLLMISDFTELKRAESARLALQLNYEQLFANSMDGILLTHPDDGGVIASNPAACSMLGLSESEIRTRDRGQILDSRDPRLADLLATREAQGWVRGEVSLVRASGEPFEVELTSTLYRDRDERTVASTIFRDITQRKRIEGELQALNATLEARVLARTRELAQRNEELAEAQSRTEEANRELQAALAGLRQAQDELVRSEKMASLGSLVAGVAHELNTPIGNAVMVASTLSGRQREFEAAMAEGLRRSALEDFLAGTREVSEVLERNLQRAAELIGSFKQIAVDQSSYQRRAFELREVAQEIALALSPTLRRSGVELIDETPAGLRMDSYPGPLGQVLINLVNNAMVHAFEGGSPGKVRVGAERLAPDRVRVVVADDGRGIAREHLNKIFDPFFTTRLGQGGSGLGLHIVYTLVTGLLGGRIDVHSEPGQGAEFHIELPMAAPASPPGSGGPF